MKKKEIYEVLDKELEWCEDERNRTMMEDWHNGFIAGLKQAKRLIKSIMKVVDKKKKLLTNMEKV